MDRALSLLIHGESKAGKSSLAVTCPAPRVYMDVESASRFLPINKIMWNPQTDPPPEWDGTWDTAVVRTQDFGVMEAVLQWLKSGDHPFKSLVVDSISELQQRYIDGKVSRNQQLSQQMWGDAFRTMSGILREMRDLTFHPTLPLEAVVLTALTKKMDGVYKPWLQGQVATVIPYIVDVCGYVWSANVTDELTGETQQTRNMLTQRTAEFEAGERVNGRLPATVALQVRPPGQPGDDISQMIDAIFGPAAPAENRAAETVTTDKNADEKSVEDK